jgi:hypothetical protein
MMRETSTLPTEEERMGRIRKLTEKWNISAKKPLEPIRFPFSSSEPEK